MAKGKSDISNSAIRVFLQKVGRAYDEARAFESFRPTPKQWTEVLEFFEHKCCYCNGGLHTEEATKDHLIPLNKESLGLHAWGNVVPCCGKCNKQKHNRHWLEYLKDICMSKDYDSRKRKIQAFLKHYHYEPNLHLGAIASNLYEDVGEVAMTLLVLWKDEWVGAILGAKQRPVPLISSYRYERSVR